MNPFQKVLAILVASTIGIFGCTKKIEQVEFYDMNYPSAVSTNDTPYVSGSVRVYSEDGSLMDTDKWDMHQARVAYAPNGDPNSASWVDLSIDEDSFSGYLPRLKKDGKIAFGVHVTGKKEGDAKQVYPTPSSYTYSLEDLLSASPTPSKYGNAVLAYGLPVDVTDAATNYSVITNTIITNTGNTNTTNTNTTNTNTPADTTNPTGSVTNPGDDTTTDNPSDSTKNVSVNVTANDNVGVQSVAVYYKKSTGGTYSSTSASLVSGSTWNATLPISNDPGRYDVYARITDTSANAFDTSVAQFTRRGTELWGHALFDSTWVSLGGASGNYNEQSEAGMHEDAYITKKNATLLLVEAVWNYRSANDETDSNVSHDATLSASPYGSLGTGYNPVKSSFSTNSKAQVISDITAVFNNLQQ